MLRSKSVSSVRMKRKHQSWQEVFGGGWPVKQSWWRVRRGCRIQTSMAPAGRPNPVMGVVHALPWVPAQASRCRTAQITERFSCRLGLLSSEHASCACIPGTRFVSTISRSALGGSDGMSSHFKSPHWVSHWCDIWPHAWARGLLLHGEGLSRHPTGPSGLLTMLGALGQDAHFSTEEGLSRRPTGLSGSLTVLRACARTRTS